MHTITLAAQVGDWIAWIAGHWIGVLSAAITLAFIYFMTALMLDLPLPFEKKAK